jgi:ATP-dependent Lhr-like helicase
LEDRGEIRGGRFVSGFSGEQFALQEAVESLRSARHRESEDTIRVGGADPLNLVGIVVPGERIAAVPGRFVLYRNGAALAEETTVTATPKRSNTEKVSKISMPYRERSAPHEYPAIQTSLRLF